MNAEIITELAHATHAGIIPFPEIVRQLIEAGVEYYHVDYVAQRVAYYSAGGAIVAAPIAYEKLPAVATSWSSRPCVRRSWTARSTSSRTGPSPSAPWRRACRVISPFCAAAA